MKLLRCKDKDGKVHWITQTIEADIDEMGNLVNLEDYTEIEEVSLHQLIFNSTAILPASLSFGLTFGADGT